MAHFSEVKVADAPECACGEPMRWERTTSARTDSEIRTFRCEACSRELHLTVWSDAGD